MDLESLRKEIDAADRELTEAFLRRMEIAGKIACVKRESGLPVFDAVREQAKTEEIRRLAGSEMEDYAAALYSLLFELSREYQGKILEETAGENER